MRFTTRLVGALLAALPLAAAYPPELLRNTREFCKSQPSDELLALHEKIVQEDKPTMDKIAKGEEVIQDILAKGGNGLHGRAPGMSVTKRDTGDLITLDAWFHVVYDTNSTDGGYITVCIQWRRIQLFFFAGEQLNPNHCRSTPSLRSSWMS